MKKPSPVSFAKPAILTLAEIKTAVHAFDRGESNVFDALDAIILAVEAYQTETTVKPIRKSDRREAA